MKVGLKVGFWTASVIVETLAQREVLARQYGPMALPEPADGPDFVLRWCDDSVEVAVGPAPPLHKQMTGAEQLEWRLIELLIHSAKCEGARVLHAGCVVFGERVLVFLAPSGGGKSALCKAALARGARYVTDDLLVVKQGRAAGLARSIRFSEVPVDLVALPPWLEGAEFLPARLPEKGKVPVFPGRCSVEREVPITNKEVVVVALRRGGDSIRELGSAERIVRLHEAAVGAAGDYDGALGSGPTYELCWTRPEDGFARIERALLGQASSS